MFDSTTGTIDATQRWEKLNAVVHMALKSDSNTRWSAKKDAEN